MDKKAKTKSKTKGLKPNKESSTHLNVDLWEQNEDRFTSCEFNLERKAHKSPLNCKQTATDATGQPIGSVVCPGNATAATLSNKELETPQLSTTPSAISIGGCASGTALVTLELDIVTVETTAPERGNWTGRFDFLLSLLGYSVGLGNVWRFPYLCYNNGGGAFLIPFTIMLIIAGLPLMFMELSFGQYAALGPVAVFRRFCPLFRGLGTGMIIVSAIVMLYYNLIIAWTIFYMWASFCTELPWQNCEPEWSTANCFSYAMADQCETLNGTYYLRNCYNATYAEEHNITELALHALKRPPAEEYFNNFVLGLSAGIEETGGIRYSLAACLLVAWVIVFLCLCKGVQSSGKVVYFTALFPYLVLVILFVRGVTLPGASTGILFYLTPDWKQLANAQVWGDAAVQIFFALSPAWGGLITLSSYNRFSNNCYKDSLIVAFCNIATSFFAGLVIFSIIGFLAHELDVEVKKVVDQGAGLAFIVYPEVVTRLPISPVWSVLFFVMLLTLGLDSQFALMETVTTAILDKFPNLRQFKTWVVLFVGIFGYVGGLGFTTNSGMYWLQLMDKYAANWSVLLIAIIECVLIAWIYGSQRFLNDIQGMIGKRSRLWNFFWGVMWRYITPATLLFILFFNWVEYKPAQYGHYVYPIWADTVGWIVGLLPVLVIFLVALQQLYKAPKHMSIKERFKYLLQPTAEWGPAGRPCVNLHAERYESQNYDGVTNTQILISGAPVDALPYEDGCNENGNGRNGNVNDNGNGNGYRDESIQLRERANVAPSQMAVVTVDTLPMTVGKSPGPGILKTSARHSSNTTQQTEKVESGRQKAMPEISPSKQPLIGAIKKYEQATATPATATTTATATVAATTKVLATGTMSSGRERNAMSTFAAGGEDFPIPKTTTVAAVTTSAAAKTSAAAAVATTAAAVTTAAAAVVSTQAKTITSKSAAATVPAGSQPSTVFSTFMPATRPTTTAAAANKSNFAGPTAINGKIEAPASAAIVQKSQMPSTISIASKPQPSITEANKTVKLAATTIVDKPQKVTTAVAKQPTGILIVKTMANPAATVAAVNSIASVVATTKTTPIATVAVKSYVSPVATVAVKTIEKPVGNVVAATATGKSTTHPPTTIAAVTAVNVVSAKASQPAAAATASIITPSQTTATFTSKVTKTAATDAPTPTTVANTKARTVTAANSKPTSTVATNSTATASASVTASISATTTHKSADDKFLDKSSKSATATATAMAKATAATTITSAKATTATASNSNMSPKITKATKTTTSTTTIKKVTTSPTKATASTTSPTKATPKKATATTTSPTRATPKKVTSPTKPVAATTNKATANKMKGAATNKK